ncbi:hypothetical protein K1719_002419 [Acacia pycnantha]|nr:hypothetical protein K1719_002419 [Acacia pycnantha]
MQQKCVGECGYFGWHDNDVDERWKVVIKALVEHIDQLCFENVKLKSGRNNGEGEGNENEAGEGVEHELSELKRLKIKQSNEILKLKKKVKTMMATLVIYWVFFAVVLSK